MSSRPSHYDQVVPLDELTEELEILNQRGYKIVEPLGEGQTRSAYTVLYTNGLVQKLRVLKLLKTEVDPNSVTTRIKNEKKYKEYIETFKKDQTFSNHIVGS